MSPFTKKTRFRLGTRTQAMHCACSIQFILHLYMHLHHINIVRIKFTLIIIFYSSHNHSLISGNILAIRISTSVRARCLFIRGCWRPLTSLSVPLSNLSCPMTSLSWGGRQRRRAARVSASVFLSFESALLGSKRDSCEIEQCWTVFQ